MRIGMLVTSLPNHIISQIEKKEKKRKKRKEKKKEMSSFRDTQNQ
jgi:hypothetical protein